ncbi:hypothetical protein ARMGADRAFT_1037977 [Armillaria gallica]|uniref:Uncharacterized protein n=1 Tax=Armillaria gallica TaxID=47427 RepID=A0A2H3D4W9_ARMGA|nr:hypothetical protein ARMGADRAFT_1037977 [Armillaria gallica]
MTDDASQTDKKAAIRYKASTLHKDDIEIYKDDEEADGAKSCFPVRGQCKVNVPVISIFKPKNAALILLGTPLHGYGRTKQPNEEWFGPRHRLESDLEDINGSLEQVWINVKRLNS